MDATVAGLIGAAIGAGTSILVLIIGAHYQQQLEKERRVWGRQDELAKELRGVIAEVGPLVYSATHSMEWLCWHAAYDPTAVDNKMLERYRDEIHENFPKLLGAVALVAPMSKGVHAELSELANEVYRLDVKVGQAMRGFRDDPQPVIERLAVLYAEIESAMQRWDPLLGELLNTTSRSGER